MPRLHATRSSVGFVFTAFALGALFEGICQVTQHGYIGAMLMIVTGFSLFAAGMELVRRR